MTTLALLTLAILIALQAKKLGVVRRIQETRLQSKRSWFYEKQLNPIVELIQDLETH